MLSIYVCRVYFVFGAQFIGYRYRARWVIVIICVDQKQLIKNMTSAPPRENDLEKVKSLASLSTTSETASLLKNKPSRSQSPASVPIKPKYKERVWVTLLLASVASIPALLVGCTLGFPSAALLDLKDLEERPEFKFNSLLSDVFGVCCFVDNYLHGHAW